ncbi:MAG: hypothetical protein IE887_07245 [Campylobacterales bacterium]|nr:hypothetical protein [Campylobacterales bacterium]
MNIPITTKITLLLLSIMTMMSNVAIITSIPHMKYLPSCKRDRILFSFDDYITLVVDRGVITLFRALQPLW